MNKLAAIVVIGLVATGVVAWLGFNLQAEKKYGESRLRLAEHVLSSVPMDAKTMSLVGKAREHWAQRTGVNLAVPYSDALKILKLKPTVSNLVHVLTYQIPEYSYLSENQNIESGKIAIVQGLLLPGTIDGSIHVSEDGQLALLKLKAKYFMIFSENGNGLWVQEFLKEVDNAKLPSEFKLPSAPAER